MAHLSQDGGTSSTVQMDSGQLVYIKVRPPQFRFMELLPHTATYFEEIWIFAPIQQGTEKTEKKTCFALDQLHIESLQQPPMFCLSNSKSRLKFAVWRSCGYTYCRSLRQVGIFQIRVVIVRSNNRLEAIQFHIVTEHTYIRTHYIQYSKQKYTAVPKKRWFVCRGGHLCGRSIIQGSSIQIFLTVPDVIREDILVWRVWFGIRGIPLSTGAQLVASVLVLVCGHFSAL